jgi:nitroreductase
MPLSECRPIEEDLKITPAQCEQLIKHRRSIRAYRDKPVARDVITRLIDVARYAPTGHNAQEVEWLVLDDQEELQRLESIGTDWIRWVIKNMGMLLRRQEKVPTTFLRGAPVLIVAHAASPIATVDCTIALSYLDLFANTKGLGCCWAGFVYIMANSFPAMKEALAIPEGHTAGGCMMLGYPKFRYHRIPVRRPAKIQWHD